MKHAAILLALAVLLLLAGVALANGDYDLSWHVIGGGGRHAEARNYALDSTVGQAVAETVSNGGYTLCSGFWCGAAIAAVEYKMYLPMMLKNYSVQSDF